VDKETVFIREEEEEEKGGEEAVFTRESIAQEDPPNAHQTQHRPKPRLN
jgi:hypothetical protein